MVKMNRDPSSVSYSYEYDANDGEPPTVRHVEFSCSVDPESGMWSMTYKTRFSEAPLKCKLAQRG